VDLSCDQIEFSVPERWVVRARPPSGNLCTFRILDRAGEQVRYVTGRDILVHQRGAGTYSIDMITSCTIEAEGSDNRVVGLPVRDDYTAQSGETERFSAAGRISIRTSPSTSVDGSSRCFATLFNDRKEQQGGRRATTDQPLVAEVPAGRYWVASETYGCSLQVEAAS
jgi:hypothetical protein